MLNESGCTGASTEIIPDQNIAQQKIYLFTLWVFAAQLRK